MFRLVYIFGCRSLLMSRGIIFLQALGESLGKGDDHKDMDIITKFLKVCTFRLRRANFKKGGHFGWLRTVLIFLDCQWLKTGKGNLQ